MKLCHKCGAPWLGATIQPGVKATCEKCTAYLHCCKNCRHHDTAKPNQCRVPNTETIANRAAANFCDEFSFREGGGPLANPKEAAARDAFGGLFGEAEVPKKSTSFDDLFGG